MELKETLFYKNVLLAINSGASTLNDIKMKVGEESAKIAKYLNVLQNLGFIKTEIPVGEKGKARNTLYSIDDNYFAFYFRFIYKHLNMLNGLISPEIYYDREFTAESLNGYIGHRFERVCSQFIMEKSYNGELPFFAEQVGRWWGNNPLAKRQEEIDIVAQDENNAILCECKYTEKAFDETELSDLQACAPCIKRDNLYFWIFSRKGVTAGVKKKIKNLGNYKVISIKELFA
jgi:AAA+ ATPase superfamily predicted ATPase